MAVELEIKKNQFTVNHANSAPPTVADRRFERSDFDNFHLALAEVLQSQESFYKSGPGESSSSSKIVHSMEMEAILKLDEALARRLQEMENSPSDNETEDLACVESPSQSDSESDTGDDTPHASNSAEASGEDDIDPDNMTYEELQRLGEEVGTENRGLSEELISYLESSKYKSGFFSKKGKHDECVICQEEYKNRERLITLPCKHDFHASCITKWLKIEKVKAFEDALFHFPHLSKTVKNEKRIMSSLLGFMQKQYYVVDRAIAEALQNQEVSLGLSSDEEIAKQLQEMENLFIGSVPDETTDFSKPTGIVPVETIPFSGDSPSRNSSYELEVQEPVDLDNMTYEELQELAEDIGCESKGLSEQTIASLPVTKVKSGFFSKSKMISKDCAICQSAIRKKEFVMTLPCKHCFHNDCIVTWLKMNKLCPMCKYEIDDKEEE